MTTATNPPLPGQPWPEQDGIYIGIMPSDDGKSAWHLILPKGPQYSFQSVAWSERGKLIAGANSRNDGMANTLAMLEAGNELIQKLLRDSYLPSRGELALCYAVAPSLFTTDGWYWSSTQSSSDSAWFQDFGYGSQGTYNKRYKARAVAVRRLIL